MKQFLVTIFLFLFSLQAISQESLEPLGINPTLSRLSQSMSRSVDQLFVYDIDTVHLPIKDDFSTDKFKKYNAVPSDANVTDTVIYAVYFTTGIRDSDTVEFMLDTTYNYVYTATATLDSFQIDTIPLAPIGTRIICDLDVFPVVCDTVTVWPAYNTEDTIGTAATPDFVYGIFPPDIIQDSAQVYFVAATDLSSIWQDNYAYRNNDYGINPPTIGVATLDGLNDNGFPYDFSTAFTYGRADYLTSKPIFMNQDAGGTGYALSDSIYLSFYYQAQGLGNEPELEDSLVLQFWSVDDNEWQSQWKVEGQALNPDFEQVMIEIKDARYLRPGFKFRFVNYSSLSGSFDHWNIDYVFFGRFRFRADTIRDDVSFQKPAHTFLKEYVAMPWKHFKWQTTAAMMDTLIVNQRNTGNAGRLIGGNDMIIQYNGVTQQTFTNVNTPSINGFTNFTTEFLRSSTYFYDTTVNDTNASFLVEVRHNTTPDFTRENDTLRFIQEFSDYYSYDDGTAEAAYGVQGIGGLNPKLASQFSLVNGDSLKSVFIHFTPSAFDWSSTPFVITIWNESGGKPGSVIYEKITLDVPRYNLGVNGFYEYPLDSNHFLPAGNYYVGISQTTTDRINVGFDKNLNNRTKTFYNSNGTWRVTGFEGTLMIRPSFVYERDYLVGITEVAQEKIEWKVYPNPTTSYISIENESKTKFKHLQIIDLSGKQLLSQPYSERIDVSYFQNGMYLIIVTNEEGKKSVKRFVKN